MFLFFYKIGDNLGILIIKEEELVTERYWDKRVLSE